MTRTLARTALLIASVASLAACSAGSVDGAVNGREVPLFRDAVYIEGDGLLGDEDLFAAVAVMTTYDNACDVLTIELEEKTQAMEQLLEDVEKASTGQDILDAYEELEDSLRDIEEAGEVDYHVATVAIAVDDDSDLADGALDAEDEDEGFQIRVCEQAGAPDYDFDDVFVGPIVLPSFIRKDGDDSRFCGTSDDGELKVKHQARERLEFSGDAELVDAADESDDAGDITFEGRATYCPSLESAFEDNIEALNDVAELTVAIFG